MSSSTSDPSIEEELDYDFIGTGGILLQCSTTSAPGSEHEHGGTPTSFSYLGLTASQTASIRRVSPFFDNCLRHDMQEASRRVIEKKDWTLPVARHLVQAMCQGSTTLTNLALYRPLLQAADQALVDLRLCNMVNYLQPCHSSNSNNNHDTFLELVDSHKYLQFTLVATITADVWSQLLEHDEVLLHRLETNYVLALVTKNNNDNEWTRDQLVSIRQLDTKESVYQVHAKQSLTAVWAIAKRLQNPLIGNDNARDNDHEQQQLQQDEEPESFSLYFESTLSIPKEHHALMERLAGGQAYQRTCPDAGDYQTEGYTVRGSCDVLRRAIQPLVSLSSSPDGKNDAAEPVVVSACSLRVDHPTPDTLGRLINATHLVKDYPSTLSYSPPKGRYTCQKSLRDVASILDYLVDFATPSKVSKPFTLYECKTEQNQPF